MSASTAQRMLFVCVRTAPPPPLPGTLTRFTVPVLCDGAEIDRRLAPTLLLDRSADARGAARRLREWQASFTLARPSGSEDDMGRLARLAAACGTTSHLWLRLLDGQWCLTPLQAARLEADIDTVVAACLRRPEGLRTLSAPLLALRDGCRDAWLLRSPLWSRTDP